VSALERCDPVVGHEIYGTRRAVLCLLLVAGFARQGIALDPSQPFSSYLRTRFTHDDSRVPSDIVNDIVQSREGFLWLAVGSGTLTRFDGRQFMALPFPRVYTLALAPDGDLWAGTDDGLERIPSAALNQFGRLPTVSYHPGPGPSSNIVCLHFSRSGVLWVGTAGGLYRYERGVFSSVIPGLWILRIEEASNGRLLLVTSKGFLEWDGSSAMQHPELAAQLGVKPIDVFHVFEDSRGVTWFCTSAGVVRRVGGSFEKLPPYGPKGHGAFRAYEDPQGNVWFVKADGLFRATTTGLELAVPNMNARCLYGDREGDLWVGTNADGLIRYKDRAVRMFTTAHGLPNNLVMTLLVTHDGSLWTGANCGGLSRFDGQRFRTYSEKDGLLNSCVWALAEDTHHDLWIGTYGGGAFRFHDGRFTQYSKGQGLPDDVVGTMVAARDGSMWFGTPVALSHIVDGRVRNYTTADGLSNNHAVGMREDRDGFIWVGSPNAMDREAGDRFVNVLSGAGMMPLGTDRSGAFHVASNSGSNPVVFRIENNLPIPVIADITVADMVETQDGDLWLSGVGIFRVPPGGLGRSRVRDDPADYAAYGRADGLTSMQCGYGFPISALTPDGKLWVATPQGVAMLDLPRLPRTDRKPAIYMKEATVGRSLQPPGRELVLPTGTQHVELNFDAIEISSPEKIRLQYRLDGVDSEWLDAAPPGHATYTNIPHGTHAFHVRACNRDGIWDRAGMVYTVTQQPYFYETVWLRLATVTAGVLLLAGFYRLRLNAATARLNAGLGERLAERERIARELHDTLLQGVQGLTLHFQAAMKQIPAEEPARHAMDKALKYADEVLLEGRQRVRDLRSEGATANELSEMLASYGDELARDREVTFKVTVVGSPRSLHPVVRDEVYRIAREALANTFRHSQASRIEVELTYDSASLCVRVRDNGCGIDQEILSSGREGHWGLSGMRERARNVGAHLSIWSNPSAGTEIDLRVPAKVAYSRSQKESLWRWIKRGASGGR
jgi:signal transduction histidine kinase/ligand-binding sensor domain-containing protein